MKSLIKKIIYTCGLIFLSLQWLAAQESIIVHSVDTEIMSTAKTQEYIGWNFLSHAKNIDSKLLMGQMIAAFPKDRAATKRNEPTWLGVKIPDNFIGHKLGINVSLSVKSGRATVGIYDSVKKQHKDIAFLQAGPEGFRQEASFVVETKQVPNASYDLIIRMVWASSNVAVDSAKIVCLTCVPGTF